jgi:hypothetical protein
MTVEMADVARVAEIARDFRRPGAPSLRDLIAGSSYRVIRPQLDLGTVEGVVAFEPQLIDDWLGYCADKRTKGGWAIDGQDRHGWTVWQPFPTTATSGGGITTALPRRARTTSSRSSTIGWRSTTAAAKPVARSH